MSSKRLQSVKADDQGKIEIDFTTSDQTGNYVINNQGITADGKFISGRRVINFN